MGDRWGREGPPDEAYSRVTRDLRAVTAEFAAYLDGLGQRLLDDFDCQLRPVTEEELERLHPHRGHDPARPEVEEQVTYAIEPVGGGCATLLVRRYLFDGASSVQLAAGLGAATQAPYCLCDACDEVSAEMIGETEEFIAMVTSGFHEFLRPAQPAGGRAAEQGWMERGHEWSGGRSVGGSAEVTGTPYSETWDSWPRR
jgi:hypothetical protein